MPWPIIRNEIRREKMGTVTCARCGRKITIGRGNKGSTAPIALGRHRGEKFLRFMCDECKDYVIEKAYRALKEKELKEKVNQLKK